MKSGIYKITNPKGRVYIGSSKNIKSRIRDYELLKCVSQTVIYNSLLKYGIENHSFEIVEKCKESDLLQRERHYGLMYDVLNKHKGLNCHLPADGEGRIQVSDELRKRAAFRVSGEKNPFFGKKHSEETKERLSAASTGRTPHNKGISGVYKASLEAKENMRKSQLGRTHTDETKYLMRLRSSNLKLVINMDTGVFYDGAKEASEAMGYSFNTFKSRLNGNKKNNTPFVFV